eukprot:TRINITY_DN94675_c0_g1_i1.p1 TRINITY_DN94675_c0_g1~~TRINITY_DN94675_c0_g1_i1.p1  ORF type:complete len:403 (-),score=73.76 TRINITY_DN94675_c0_g1_i1:8-1189(-)
MKFFVVSLPFKKTGAQNAVEQFTLTTRELGLDPNVATPFPIPALKVGSLDSLLECSDDLNKLDSQVEGITFKILGFLADAANKGIHEVAEIIPAGNKTPIPFEEYICSFKWAEAQFQATKPLKALLIQIHEQVSRGEENIRAKLQDYNDAKQKLSNVEKKQSSSLATKPIAKLVNEWYASQGAAAPINSEYLCTLFVIVPTGSMRDWERQYPALVTTEIPKIGKTNLIVPGSSTCIAKEQDFALYNVVLFKKIAEEFKQACRERKWIVREYDPTEDMTAAEVEQLKTDIESKKNTLVRFLKTTFSEAYIAWIHLKAIRVFVESVLRYGLPPAFVAILLRVDAKRENTIRRNLAAQCAQLNAKKLGDDEASELNALELQYPYVSLKIAGPDART